jgi:hypothetical protein
VHQQLSSAFLSIDKPADGKMGPNTAAEDLPEAEKVREEFQAGHLYQNQETI